MEYCSYTKLIFIKEIVIMSFSTKTFPAIQTKDYASARDSIKSGDILMCSGSSIFSKMIQKGTNSVWSHIAFILRLDVIDRIMVLESVESIGVRTIPLSNYVYDYNGKGNGYPGKLLIARHDEFNQANIRNFSKRAVDLFGHPYDMPQVLYLAATWLGRQIINIKSQQNIMPENNAYSCSEYVYECYKSLGIIINYNNQGFIAPCDFASNPSIQAITFLKSENI